MSEREREIEKNERTHDDDQKKERDDFKNQ